MNIVDQKSRRYDHSRRQQNHGEEIPREFPDNLVGGWKKGGGTGWRVRRFSDLHQDNRRRRGQRCGQPAYGVKLGLVGHEAE